MLHDTADGAESEGTVVILLSASAASISFFFQFRYYIDTKFTKYRDVDIDITLSQ